MRQGNDLLKDERPATRGPSASVCLRAERRVHDTTNFEFTMPVPKQQHYQRPKKFDMEKASTEELMDEIIRITVFDYKALCAKMATSPIPESERELIEFMKAKYAMESKLVDGYLNRLQEVMRDTPPGYIHAAIQQREREIREKLRAG